jgi:Protein of unknown function (DUF1553)
MQFLELFDAADACDAYKRTASIVPQQALAMVNNEMLIGLSGRLAGRLWAEMEVAYASIVAGEARLDKFIDVVFEQVLSRRATAAEKRACQGFLRKQAALLAKGGAVQVRADAEARARADFVHALFSHHDFVTIH